VELSLKVNNAAYLGKTSHLKSLIKSGANPNWVDYHGRSPLVKYLYSIQYLYIYVPLFRKCRKCSDSPHVHRKFSPSGNSCLHLTIRTKQTSRQFNMSWYAIGNNCVVSFHLFSGFYGISAFSSRTGS
jgi:hypothetical protein